MKQSKTIVIIVMSLLVLTSFSALAGQYEYSCDDELLDETYSVEFHFIDVGQADATLIRSSEATKLIDAGSHIRQDVVDYLYQQNITDIDLLVGTHPHADHIGQMAQIIEEFNVGEVWMSGYEHDSNTYDEVYEAIDEHNVTYNNPRANENYQYGKVEFEVINPVNLTEDMDIHESCLAFRAVYGNFSAMFTGDVEWETEHEIIDRGHELGTDVYQAGHHGSSTSSSEEFLNSMNPEVTIYSSEPSVYGHPHEEVVERMDAHGIEQYGTYEYGTIIVTAYEDGNYELSHEKENHLENEFFEDWYDENNPEHWNIQAQAGRSEHNVSIVGNYSLHLGPHGFAGPYNEYQTFNHEEADGRVFTYHGEVWVRGTGYVRLGILRPGYSMRSYSEWHIVDTHEWIPLNHEVQKDDRPGTEGEFIVQHTSSSDTAGDENETLNEVDLYVGAAWMGTQTPPEDWPVDPTIEISNVHQLQNMRSDLEADYVLVNDIDASETVNWSGGAGFEPIGTGTCSDQTEKHFTGSLDGNGYEIIDLYINRPNTLLVGLFGYIGENGEVQNLGVVDADVSGEWEVGVLAGRTWHGVTINNSYSTGTVSGINDGIGGLVGRNNGGTVSNSYSKADVEVGFNLAGGVVGDHYQGTVSNSYSTGNVSGRRRVGGLVGSNRGVLSNSYATGTVDGEDRVGGLVGINVPVGSVSNSYATGTVNGENRVGGLVGFNWEGTVENSYATGYVSGDWNVGGLIGYNDGVVSNSFYDWETTGQVGTGQGEPKTTEEMKTHSTFTDVGWDFDNVWHMVENITYPLLQWLDLPETTSIEVDLEACAGSNGWNFVSFNIDMADTSIENILANTNGSYDRLMYYDASTERWVSYVHGRAEHFNNLQSWDNTMGIWIQVNTSATLNITGYTPLSTDLTLYPGWNMVGLPSESSGNHDLPGEVTSVGQFNSSDEYNIDYVDADGFEFSPGNGYWLYNGADEAVVWTVEY